MAKQAAKTARRVQWAFWLLSLCVASLILISCTHIPAADLAKAATTRITTLVPTTIELIVPTIPYSEPIGTRDATATLAVTAAASTTPVRVLTLTSTATPTAVYSVTPTITPSATPTVTPSVTPTTEKPGLTVKNDIVNVRAGPGTAYPVISVVRKDQSIDVTGVNASREWWQTPLGWINAGLVVANAQAANAPVIKNIPPPPPSPTAAATLSLEQEARNVAAAVDVRFADKADNELVRERIVRIALRAPRDIQIGTFDDEFRQYWKTRWSDKYPRARLEDLIVEPSIKTVLNDPLYVFRSKRLRYIGPLDECRWTCWRAGDTGHVELGEYLHTSDWPYPTEAGASLVAEAVLYKESLAVGIYAPVIVFVSRDGVNLTNKDSGLIIENLTMYLEYKYVERYRALMSDVEWDFFYRVVGLRDVAMKDCCFTQ